MPNPSGRLDNSAMESMCMLLLSLTSIYEEQDPADHPRMCVIFNNVSVHTYASDCMLDYEKFFKAKEESKEKSKEESKEPPVED